jgi:hypothetical protein
MRPRRIRILTSRGAYRNRAEFTLIVFDLRIPGAAERFHRERWAWAEAGNVEMLDENHPVLLVKPGSARRLSP